MLCPKGAIVTADALNRQRATAGRVVAQGGDYALTLKANQPALHADVVLLFDDPGCAIATAPPNVGAGHDRIEPGPRACRPISGFCAPSTGGPA